MKTKRPELEQGQTQHQWLLGWVQGLVRVKNKSAHFFWSSYSHSGLPAKSQKCIKCSSDFKSAVGKGYGALELYNQEAIWSNVRVDGNFRRNDFTCIKSNSWRCTHHSVSDWSCLAQSSGVTAWESELDALQLCYHPAPSQPPSVKYTTSVTLLTAGHHIYSVRQTVWYHGHKLAQLVYEAIAEGGRKWVPRVRQSRERRREFKRVSVYWCTSLSSQQEFFPCFIITARLPIHKRLWRKVESPPDVISSTFTYNHIEKQHGCRSDGLSRIQYRVYAEWGCLHMPWRRASNMNSATTAAKPPKQSSPTSSQLCHCEHTWKRMNETASPHKSKQRLSRRDAKLL